jgi:hypothetical protein
MSISKEKKWLSHGGSGVTGLLRHPVKESVSKLIRSTVYFTFDHLFIYRWGTRRRGKYKGRSEDRPALKLTS